MSLATALNFVSDRLYNLPLAVVYVTERCHSKCVGCDFWRHGSAELAPDRARTLARELKALGTIMVLLTGGEPLFHSRWRDVALGFREEKLRLWLLTSGISLPRDRRAVGELFERATISLDGATPASYRATRGVDAFDAVVEGIEGLVADGMGVTLRTTVQKRNFLEMPELVRLARRLGVRRISFLPVDVRSRHAFARSEGASAEGLALDRADLPAFESVLDEVEHEIARFPHDGIVAESPPKLRRMVRYFGALLGLEEFPEVRCNAPRFSAVVRPDGSLQPCHFIEGASSPWRPLSETLNSAELVAIRKAIRRGSRDECLRCVCPMRRAPWELMRQSIAGD